MTLYKRRSNKLKLKLDVCRLYENFFFCVSSSSLNRAATTGNGFLFFFSFATWLIDMDILIGTDAMFFHNDLSFRTVHSIYPA